MTCRVGANDCCVTMHRFYERTRKAEQMNLIKLNQRQRRTRRSGQTNTSRKVGFAFFDQGSFGVLIELPVGGLKCYQPFI